MSEKMGPVRLGSENEHIFLGKELGTHHTPDYSDETARAIDEEIRLLVDQSHARSKKLMTANRDKLDNLAKALIEHESLDAEQIEAAIQGTLLSTP
jgi:cell division protease FtsH